MLRERLAGGDAAEGVRTLDLVMVDREGARVPLVARLTARELSQQGRCHVLRLRPHLGARPMFLLPDDEPGETAEDAPARLRKLLEGAEPPVLARFRLADPARVVGRSGPAAAEVSAALCRTAGELLTGLLGEQDLLLPHGSEEFLVVAPDASGLAAVRRVGAVAAALERGLEASPRLAHSLLAAGGVRAAEEARAVAAIDVAARPLDLAPEDAAAAGAAAFLARRLQAEEAVLGADVLRSLNPGCR
jgi:hypothetical protein